MKLTCMKKKIRRRLTTLFLEGCRRITASLGKIEFKIFYFFKCLNLIFSYLNWQFTSMNQVAWFLVQDIEKFKEICKRKRSSRMRRNGRIEEFQTFARLRSYTKSLYPARDIWAFHAAIAVRYGEPK